jgi:hypothetical protein
LKIIQHNGYGKNTPPYEERKSPWSFKPFSIVVEHVPESDEIVGLVSRFLEGETVEVAMNVGVARCHPKDDFCRRTA